MEVVRCYECDVPHNAKTGCPKLNGLITPPDFFCYYGEKRDIPETIRKMEFRGKQKDNAEWVYGGILHQTDLYGRLVDRWFIIDGTNTQDYDIGYQYEVEAATIGQYIGCRDKNKKKIFEGDILTASENLLSIIGASEAYLVVGFIDSGFAALNEKGEAEFWFNEPIYDALDEKFVNNDLEIVGNIYDNPELLKEEEET